MEYEVRCSAIEKDINISTFIIICMDSEAKAFMKAVNKELRRMEAERKREITKGLKEGIRATPHKFLHKEGNKFSFDNLHLEDVYTAAESLGKQRIKIRASFVGSLFEITPEHVETFELAIEKQKIKTWE